jgi:hypothetical protein
MADQKMSFEGLIYYGTVGSRPGAGGLIPETRDMSMTYSTDKGNTTVRAVDGSGNPLIPIETENVTVRKWQFDFQTLNVPENAIIAALLAASFAGTPIAFRTKDYAAGKGFDGDVILEHKQGISLRGEQTLDFTAKPTRAGGRLPDFYVV